MTGPVVRPYRPSDRETVRRISCDTAVYGEPIDSFFPDRRFVADALVEYYTAFEPVSLFVAESDGAVVGYLTGCAQTRRYERLFMLRILPCLMWRCTLRGHWFRGSFWRLAYVEVQATCRSFQVGRSVLILYPAHCHMNMETGFRHAGIGTQLLEAFLSRLRAQGVPGIHIITATEPGKEFFHKSGFSVLVRYPSPEAPGLDSREVWIMGKKI